MGSGYCSSVNFAFPFIKTPMHVSENLMDSNQLFAQLGVPQDSNNVTLQYVSPYFITAMKTGLRQITLSSFDSVWALGCVKHTENLNLVSSTLVSGITLKQSLDSWYFNGNVSPYLIDTCQGVNCGDGCGSINVDESEYMTQWLF